MVSSMNCCEVPANNLMSATKRSKSRLLYVYIQTQSSLIASGRIAENDILGYVCNVEGIHSLGRVSERIFFLHLSMISGWIQLRVHYDISKTPTRIREVLGNPTTWCSELSIICLPGERMARSSYPRLSISLDYGTSDSSHDDRNANERKETLIN